MGSRAGTGKIAVRRDELATREMDVMAALINRQYVEHKAWFRCPAPSRVDAGIRSATAGPLEVSVARYRGFEYYAQASGPEVPGARRPERGRRVHPGSGAAAVRPRGRGPPPERRALQSRPARLRVLARSRPEEFLADFAEERLGLAAGSTRIESIAPLSRSAGARWSRAAAFICAQLLDDQDPAISPVLAHEMTRMAAATVLDVFPPRRRPWRTPGSALGAAGDGAPRHRLRPR